ncbi:phage major capsid protein [Mycobacterium interjectum]|nr:phage major capsid protein [Mycobacterium interjectum]
MLEAAQKAGRETFMPAEEIAIADLDELDKRIAHLQAQENRAHGNSWTPEARALHDRLNHPQPSKSSEVNKYANDPALVYRQYDRGGPGGKSWLRDLVRVHCGWDDNGESRRNLADHARDVAQHPAYMEQRDLSRTDSQGGYAVPPAWLLEQYIELARPGRAFANLVQRQPLPGGTDSINIPKVLSGTTVGVQTSDNSTVSDTDLTDTFINAPVRTIAGQQGVAIQLIDQSPIAFDDVVFRDLVAAHAAAVDTQVLDGSGTNGQVLGVDYTPGINTVTADALTVQGIYNALANAIQTIHTTRFLPPEVIVMHPRRWGWLLSQLDTTGRPLFIPSSNGPWNVAGLETAVVSQQVVGSVQGLPVVTDPNITVTNGPFSPSGNEDLIYVCRASDLVLWESGIRARVLPETKAANLTVLLQVYSYLAFSAARYPQSVVVIDGLSAPTF